MSNFVVLAFSGCERALSPAPPAPAVDELAPAPPIQVEVHVEGPSYGLRDLRCVSVAAHTSTVWLLDGAESPHRGDLLPAETVQPGERWSCGVVVEDRSFSSPPFEVPAPVGGNVLLVVLDDVGIDKVAAYGAHPQPAHTPTIDGLVAEGVTFRTAYAAPSCSISRSQLLTGRYGLRTGVRQTIVPPNDPFALPDEELTLPEMLESAPEQWTSAVLGKWHLVDREWFGPTSVTDQGFDTFQGTVANLMGDYYRWEQWSADGTRGHRSGYSSTAIVDDTLAFVETAPEPWLAWVAFHAAHTPLQPPPPELTSRPSHADDPGADLVDAMIEAADAELGRLLASMDPAVRERTTVMVLGDNGTADLGVRPPLDPDRAKLTVYEGGVRVPLVIAGHAVAGASRTSDALVENVDLFATIADLAGVPLSGGSTLSVDGEVAIDGRSLLPLLRDPEAVGERSFLYASKAHPNGPPPWVDAVSTVRDADWKYVFSDAGEELYFLADEGLDEGPDLLRSPLSVEAAAARERLADELARIEAETPYGR